ncbi:hypothetical protein KG088_16620 [Halomonas sp. TRM85114]|uniref:hypothetical protein n=1 Tax=Halomonas jincaotanensis TaxID=2810616 RepID=UPI001BD58E46|nr:hypothetical protein [Halomonas jincaotanensis]MBS9405242.1 hypothetical protein [Halomonas jincaotanensis]
MFIDYEAHLLPSGHLAIVLKRLYYQILRRGKRHDLNSIAMIYLIGSFVGRLLDQAKST